MRSVAAVIAGALAAGCVGDVGPGEGEAGGEVRKLAHNKLAHNKLAHNALTANPTNLRSLAFHALSTATFGAGGDPDLRLALHDPNAREAFKYLVECALPSGQSITTASAAGMNDAPATYYGLLGLCPEWGAAGPEQSGFGGVPAQCEQRVSACLLARVNAFGKPVLLSLRGNPTAMFDPTGSVTSDPYTVAGASVASLQACFGTATGMANCGWEPLKVGTCWKGSTVDVGLGAAVGACQDPLGTPAGDTVLRVCDGVHACDSGTAVAASDDTCGLNPAVKFTCPNSGRFAVMWAPYNRSSSRLYKPVAGARGTTAVYYPAMEGNVIPQREAAYYGNIFDVNALNPALAAQPVVVNRLTGAITGATTTYRGAVFQHMYACWAPEWSYGNAYMTNRVCGGPTANDPTQQTYNPTTDSFGDTQVCTAKVVGPCETPLGELRTWALPPAVGVLVSSLGLYIDGPLCSGISEWGAYGSCKDRNGTWWPNPITVDLVDRTEACQTLGIDARYCAGTP